MRSRRKVQNRMSVLKRTGKKNVLALALAIAMVSSTVAGEPLSIHAYADETNAIYSSDDGSSKSSGKTEQVKEEKTSSKEEKTEAKTEKASEERSTGKSETSAAAKSAIKIVTEAENSAASDTKSSDVKIGFSENMEKSNASGQKSSGSSDNTSATSATEKSTEASNAGSSASGESSTEKATETKTNTSDAETKSSTASSDTNSSTENTSSASNGANGSAAGTGTSTGAGETTAPETNATETSATETTAAVETTAVETIAPETTAELDEEAQKKAESARIRKGILAADTAARKAKLGKTGSWKSSIFDFVKHLFYINVVADAENEADDVEDESISEMEVSEDDIDDYSVDLGKDYTANVVDDEDHVSGKNCFTSIIMARKVSGKWKAQSEFHDEDSVRVSLAVSIPSDAMDEDSRVFYYQLPASVVISSEQSGLMKRDDIVIGKYVLTEDGMLVVKLTDNISVNQKFRGIIVFDAELAKADDQTMEKIDFGSYVFILHDGVSNDSKGGDAEDIDADVTDETETTDTIQDDANKVATESEIDADGEFNTRAGVLKVKTYAVTATANYPEGTFPIGTKMQVVRVKKPSELKTLKTKVDAALESENNGKIAKSIYAYDISFLYDGEKIEPKNPVDISLSFNKSTAKPKASKGDDPEKAEWKMYHATTDENAAQDINASIAAETEEDEDADKKKASDVPETSDEKSTSDLVTEDSVLDDITKDTELDTTDDKSAVHKVDFSSDAFSVYVLAYTVDFHFGDYLYSLEGTTEMLLSDLFNELEIEKDAKDVINVTFSNEELLEVNAVKDENENIIDWRLTSLQPFSSNELLTVTFEDGEILTIEVTDYQYLNDLYNLLSEIKLYKGDKEITGDQWQLVANEKYKIKLSFKEDSTYQFVNDGSTMYYTFPKGIYLPDNKVIEGVFTMDLGGNIELQGNKYKIIPGTNGEPMHLEVIWNTNDTENFEYLKSAKNAHFEAEVDACFREEFKSFKFNDTISIIVDISEPHDASVDKSGTYNAATDSIDYTVKVHSKGKTSDITVTDTIEGSALTLEPGSIKYSTSNGGNALDIPSSWNLDVQGNKFSLMISELQNDKDIYITYSARINYTNLNNGSVTVNPTQNKVEIHCKRDDNPDNNQKTITNEINYSTISKSNTGIVDDSANKVKTLTWVILANKEHKTSLSGTIEDKIGDESKDVMSYSGSGIKVIVRDSNDNVVGDDRKISWNGGDDTVGKLTLDTTNKTWKYTIPSCDAGKNYSYEITYTTDVNYENQTADFTVKNKVKDEHDSNSGTGVITIGDDNKINYEKNVQKISGQESIEWSVVVNVPYKENGLSEFLVTDTLPFIWIDQNRYYDQFNLDSLSVTGLQDGESYQVQYHQGDPNFQIDFYRGNGNKGLLPNSSKTIRSLTITYTTMDNPDWVNYAKTASNKWYRDHENKVKINDLQEKSAKASVTPQNIIKQNFKNDHFYALSGKDLKGLVPYDPNDGYVNSLDDKTTYYVASYQIFVEGVNTESVTIHDTFNTNYLKYIRGDQYNYHDQYFGCDQYETTPNSDGGACKDAIIKQTDTGIDITLPSVQKRKSNGDYFARYGVRYWLLIKPEMLSKLCDLAAQNGGELPIKNIATWLESRSSVDATLKYKVVDKTVNTDDAAKPRYKIVINREKSRLNEGNVMQLTDTFTNQIIDLSTIQITTDPESKKSEVKYALEKDKLLFTIPDETKVTIEYSAFVTGSGKVSYSNTAELTGGYYDETTRNVQIESSAVGGASLVYIKLNKYDITNPAKKLAGAKFKLENEDGSAFTDNRQEMVFVTNEKGQIVGATNGIKSISFDNTNVGNTSESLSKNTVYYLEEIEAPEEYALLDKKIGFIFADNDYHQDENSYIDVAGNEVYIFRSVNGIFNISNKKGEKYLLPATGSRGTSWIYLLGSIILLMAAELYFLKRKEVDRR